MSIYRGFYGKSGNMSSNIQYRCSVCKSRRLKCDIVYEIQGEIKAQQVIPDLSKGLVPKITRLYCDKCKRDWIPRHN